MKQVTDAENVIEVNFNSSQIQHPASKNFPVESDPLEELLSHYDDVEAEEPEVCEPQFERLSFDTPMMRMCDEVNARINHLKKSAQRLKYYLDESYID